ncbi:sialic acid-binding Ig-like lectin 14 isoform X1 [Xiphophorus hellerii]|uniref:sialic acid-binding Ig-like lectin 14 isoform X1 n=1 Tax=Xiphophorus hellerii TaxID=8084 RepID=UPI0013B358F7|nr:sialic acid-binding Ig-like lectin 14 isoform X1 [Xiphophorus hellerii]XP_032406768.1 sialic acid-binding Ig-like lectin 14 isoform X1 [Xiphophorus hellerii]XP_032406769.1 sialic acid-binding Ig-like lectin 14 isoform X1 [Xiphophorus hellerii]
MKDDNQSLMAALSEKMLTVSMLLSVFFIPGVFAGDSAGCPNPDLIADIPRKIEALSGSCLQIPCKFSSTHYTFNNRRPIYGVWLRTISNLNRNPEAVIFNSSGSVNTFSLKMTGNLSEGDCTTLFPDLKTSYTDKYFLRIHKVTYMATAECHPLNITVKDSPWRPSINISGGDLKEHQSVTITCSAFTPCPHSPPELTWNLQQDSLRQTEKNTDGTFTTKIQENITLSDTHDGYNISCSARYPVIGGIKTAETKVTLSVSYAPRNTSASISPSGLVSAGSRVELNCSSRAKPPPSFTWFRNSKDGAMNVSGQVYGFNATERGEYYCVATNDLGNQTSSLISVNMINKQIDTTTVLLWLPIVAGCICFICLMAIAAWLCKLRRSTPRPTKQRNEDPAFPMRAEKTEEELYYAALNFLPASYFLPASSASDQDGEQQETLYAEVKVSADGLEGLYAEVNKKRR